MRRAGQEDAAVSDEGFQGLCDTTMTERFANAGCCCDTYPGNLGPCKTFLEGARPGHCVYCDHEMTCHQHRSDLSSIPAAGV
jgi:hypothetical protein